jgi:hypothetical protein
MKLTILSLDFACYLASVSIVREYKSRSRTGKPILYSFSDYSCLFKAQSTLPNDPESPAGSFEMGYVPLIALNILIELGCLKKVAESQASECALRRVVRVIVTSRVALIDQAQIPGDVVLTQLHMANTAAEFV